MVRTPNRLATPLLACSLLYALGCSGAGTEEETASIELGPGTHLLTVPSIGLKVRNDRVHASHRKKLFY